MTICAQALVFITIKLTAVGYEPSTVEACFEDMHSCKVFEQIVIKRLTEASDGQVGIKTDCRGRR